MFNENENREETELLPLSKHNKKLPKIKKEKPNKLGKQIAWGFVVLLLVTVGVFYCAEWYVGWREHSKLQIPIVWRGFIGKVEKQELSVIVKEEKKEPKEIWTGEASYYSFAGCVGCNPRRVMANGEVLDDMKKTIAFNKVPLGTEVMVTNMSNGVSTPVTVTDRGGFEELGRIADLSVATKKVIGCNDLCQVKVEVF